MVTVAQRRRWLMWAMRCQTTSVFDLVSSTSNRRLRPSTAERKTLVADARRQAFGDRISVEHRPRPVAVSWPADSQTATLSV
jgi:hypothetical protein